MTTLQSETEPVPSLTDRRGLFRHLHAALEDSELGPFAVMLARIDKVTLCNATTQGDMSELVLATAGPDGVGAELHDLTYAILFPVSGWLEACMVGDAFRRAAGNPVVVAPGITVSTGVAVTAGACSPEDLMKAATWALHVAQRRGGNRVVVYDAVRLTPIMERSDDSSSSLPRAADLL